MSVEVSSALGLEDVSEVSQVVVCVVSCNDVCGAPFVSTGWYGFCCSCSDGSDCSRMTCSALARDTAWLISPCGFLLNGISGSGSKPRLSLHSFAVLLVAA